MAIHRTKWLGAFAALLLIAAAPPTYDDAVILSRRVTGQAYSVADSLTVLRRGNNVWGIPLWSCDPDSIKIIKVLGNSGPAPYAIEITVGPDQRIDGLDNVMRLQSIHLLAASLEDAVKMRRAVIAEISTMQRFLERRQGNRPGFLGRVVQSHRQ